MRQFIREHDSMCGSVSREFSERAITLAFTLSVAFKIATSNASASPSFTLMSDTEKVLYSDLQSTATSWRCTISGWLTNGPVLKGDIRNVNQLHFGACPRMACTANI